MNVEVFASGPVSEKKSPEKQKVEEALDLLAKTKVHLTEKMRHDTEVWTHWIIVSQTWAGFRFVDDLVAAQLAAMQNNQIMRELLATKNLVTNWGLNAPPNKVDDGSFPPLPKNLADYIESL